MPSCGYKAKFSARASRSQTRHKTMVKRNSFSSKSIYRKLSSRASRSHVQAYIIKGITLFSLRKTKKSLCIRGAVRHPLLYPPPLLDRSLCSRGPDRFFRPLKWILTPKRTSPRKKLVTALKLAISKHVEHRKLELCNVKKGFPEFKYRNIMSNHQLTAYFLPYGI